MTAPPAAAEPAADADSGSASAARGSAFFLVGTLLGAFANFAMLAIVQRHYGKEIFGVFSGVTALFLVLATVARLGADTGATWFVARLVSQSRWRETPTAVRVATLPVVLLSTAVMAVVWVLADRIAGGLTKPPEQDAFRDMLRILVIGLPLATVGEVLMGATRGLGSMRPTVVANQLGRQVGQFVLVVGAVLVSDDLRLLALAWTVPYLAAVVYPTLWLRSKLTQPTRPSAVPWAPFWRYCSPQAANSSTQIGLEKFDILAIGELTGAAAAAEYSAANRLAHVVVLGWFAINTAHGPLWARMFEERRDREVAVNARTASIWSVLFVGPMLWSFVFFGRGWLGLIGSDVVDGARPLAVLAATLLVALLIGPSENLLLMMGGSGRSFLNNAFALAVNVVLNLVLIPSHGTMGAATAWLAALLTVRVLATVQVWSARRVLVIAPALVEAWLVVAAVGCVTGLGGRLLLGGSFLGLVGGGLATLPLLGLAIWVRRDAYGVAHMAASLGRRGEATPAVPVTAGPVDPAVPVAAGPVAVGPVGRDETDGPGLPPSFPSLVGPHLEMRLRSRAVIRHPLTRERVHLLTDVAPVAGWKGRLLRTAIERVGSVAPAQLERLPWFEVHPNAPLPIEPRRIRAILAAALTHVPDRTIDGAVWLLPPRGDEVRVGALLLNGAEPVAHLRVKRRSRFGPGPRPAISVGPRTGVRWSRTLARWDDGTLVCELSSALWIPRHEPARIGDADLLALVDDITDALRADTTPPPVPARDLWPMHGDLTPWNLRVDRDGNLALFDWEHAGWGPLHADLVRYCVTAPDGADRFARLPASVRAEALPAVEHWQWVARARAAQPAQTRWKQADRANEVRRLEALAALARPTRHHAKV